MPCYQAGISAETVAPFWLQVARERDNVALAPVSTAEAVPEGVSTLAHLAYAGVITPSSPRLTGSLRPFASQLPHVARGAGHPWPHWGPRRQAPAASDVKQAGHAGRRGTARRPCGTCHIRVIGCPPC